MADLTPLRDVNRLEEEYRDERKQLREQLRHAETEAERTAIFVRFAELDRERHADIYAKLARE